MKVRFFITDDDPDVHEIPLAEVAAFLELIRSTNIDKDGSYYRIDAVNYDVNQHAIDVMCVDAG